MRGIWHMIMTVLPLKRTPMFFCFFWVFLILWEYTNGRNHNIITHMEHIMDNQNWIMDIHNCIVGKYVCSIVDIVLAIQDMIIDT